MQDASKATRRRGAGTVSGSRDVARQPDVVQQALAEVRTVEFETPPGLAERVLQAVEAAEGARLEGLRDSARRASTAAWRAASRHTMGVAGRACRSRAVQAGLASTAAVGVAVAVGLQARHQRRGREAAA